MNCKKTRQLLWSFCEGTLGEGSVGSVKDHLRGCPLCRREQAEMERTLGAVHAFGAIEPRPDFHARLWQKIDAWETGRHRFWLAVWAAFIRRNRRLVATSCVAFVMALLGGLYVMHNVTGPAMVPGGRVAQEAGGKYEGLRIEGPAPTLASGKDVRQNFVMRDIPYRSPVITLSDGNALDTIYVRFPTRELTPPGGFPRSAYVDDRVVTPVSESEPIY